LYANPQVLPPVLLSELPSLPSPELLLLLLLLSPRVLLLVTCELQSELPPVLLSELPSALLSISRAVATAIRLQLP
jgi:hypothetical protein